MPPHNPHNFRNSLSSDMIAHLAAALQSAGKDPSVRVVVLAASPPVFSAGHDLRELIKECPDEAHTPEAIFNACAELMLGIRALPVPVIASVAGNVARLKGLPHSHSLCLPCLACLFVCFYVCMYMSLSLSLSD